MRLAFKPPPFRNARHGNCDECVSFLISKDYLKHLIHFQENDSIVFKRPGAGSDRENPAFTNG
jgi:hypothetical protein